MLLISLALHGLLLFTPLSSEQSKKPDETKPEDQKVKLTQLPPVDQTVPASPAPRTPPRPTVAVPRRTVIATPRLNAPPQRLNAPPPVRPNRSEVRSPQSAPPPAPPAGSAFLADVFPYPGSVKGTYDLTQLDSFGWKTTDSLNRVREWFDQKLREKGYNISLNRDDANRVVFQVSKGATTQYLTLIPNSSGSGTNILRTSQELPGDLGNISQEDPLVTQFFEQFPIQNPSYEQGQGDTSEWQAVTADQLPQPDAFYDIKTTDANGNSVSGAGFSEEQLKNGIRRAVLRVGVSDPSAVAQELAPQFTNLGCQFQSQGNYGGGLLYVVDKCEGFDEQRGFVSFVPTKGDSAIAIFIWEKAPI
jgi:hypothetical protein